MSKQLVTITVFKIDRTADPPRIENKGKHTMGLTEARREIGYYTRYGYLLSIQWPYSRIPELAGQWPERYQEIDAELPQPAA